MSEMITVGDAIARTLEQYHVEAIYGVISIHNLPIANPSRSPMPSASGKKSALFRRAVKRAR